MLPRIMAVMAVLTPPPAPRRHAKVMGLSSLGGGAYRRMAMTSVVTLLRIPKEFSDAHSFEVGVLLPGALPGSPGPCTDSSAWQGGCHLGPWVTCTTTTSAFASVQRVPRCNSLSGV